jgi:hypothetical protein
MKMRAHKTRQSKQAKQQASKQASKQANRERPTMRGDNKEAKWQRQQLTSTEEEWPQMRNETRAVFFFFAGSAGGTAEIPSVTCYGAGARVAAYILYIYKKQKKKEKPRCVCVCVAASRKE